MLYIGGAADLSARIMQYSTGQGSSSCRRYVLDHRRAVARPPVKYDTSRGYVALHRRHVVQAHLGADLDFLVGCSDDAVKRESY